MSYAFNAGYIYSNVNVTTAAATIKPAPVYETTVIEDMLLPVVDTGASMLQGLTNVLEEATVRIAADIRSRKDFFTDFKSNVNEYEEINKQERAARKAARLAAIRRN